MVDGANGAIPNGWLIRMMAGKIIWKIRRTKSATWMMKMGPDFRKPPCGWWFGAFFFNMLRIFIPTDLHIFQRGGEKPPTSHFGVLSGKLPQLWRKKNNIFFLMDKSTKAIFNSYIRLLEGLLWVQQCHKPAPKSLCIDKPLKNMRLMMVYFVVYTALL